MSESPKRGGWRRKLIWVAGVFAVVVLAVYFVGTSAAFFKKVILPKVGEAINTDVTVADFEFSPFRRVLLRDLKLKPHGTDPLLTIREVRARYSLLSILGGKIAVQEVTVESPVITVVENADGTSNLDPLLKAGTAKKKPEPAVTAKSSPAAQLNVGLVALKNATVRVVKIHPGGGRDVTEVTGLNFTARDIKNGQSGKLELAADLAMDKAAQAGAPAGSLRAKIGGAFTFGLLADLKPAAVKGNTTLTVEQATGGLADLATLGATLDCEITPTEVKQIALRFAKAGAALGEVRIAGPFDGAKSEGKLKLEILSLDRQLLNLAGAASGIDFGTTTINSSTDIELANGGKGISLGGRLDIAHFQATRLGQTSPTLDLRCDYAATVDNTAQSASLKTLELVGTQNQSPLMQASLTSPMTIAWGNAGSAAGDATFNLALTSLRLADWKAFAGETSLAGVASAKLKLVSRQDGRQLSLELDSGVEKFSAKFGSNQVNPADLRLQARAQTADLKTFKLEDYRFEIVHQGEAALVVSGSGTFDSAKQDSDLQFAVQVQLARLLALLPQPDANVTAGALDFKGRVAGKEKNTVVTGQLALTDFTGRYGNYHFIHYGTVLDFDVEMKNNQIEIRKASGLVTEAQNAGGHFEVSGSLDPAQMSGHVDVKLADFNQEGLRPFLESALGDKKLVSVALNTTAAVNLGAKGDTSIKTDLQITNLVVNDPAGALPSTALEARVQVDATVTKQVAHIRQCQLALTPATDARNELNLTGSVDSSKSNAITGNLKLAAESLDVTRYYDLFAGKPQTNAPLTATKGAAPDVTAPAPAGPEREPDAMILPLQDFTFDLNIGRLVLREVDIRNLQATAKLDGGHVVLNPCRLTLNGAPVTASVDLDLGVPGYRYNVSFGAQAVPLTPLVNSFMPERKHQIGGHLIAGAEIRGAGITGDGLQKNLAGQFNLLATNINLSISDVRSPTINAVINVIVGLPELIRNPAAIIGWRDGAHKGGWADELTARPVEVVSARGSAGKGRVEIQQAEVHSAAFRVQVAGDITLAAILTNSAIQFPVRVGLGLPYADKIGLVNSSTPTNEPYVALPDFLKLKGTVGKPETELNKGGLTALAAKAVGGIGKELGVATGDSTKKIYDTVGNLLGTSKPAAGATNAPADSTTNGPAEPQKKSGLLDFFKKPKKQ